MEIKKWKSILFVGLIVFGFPGSILPNKVHADDGEYVSGCCQFFMEKSRGVYIHPRPIHAPIT
ncbi:MAG TPA: hypothetical protein PKC29_11795 [Thermodesulfobacteriota bacterium]|nr:hypothetical protein [Thermodesulfobacteriota bacterium]